MITAMKQVLEALRIVWPDDYHVVANLHAAIEAAEKCEPVACVPTNVAYSAVSHVAMANYASREREAREVIRAASRLRYTHPAPITAPANLDELAVEVAEYLGLIWTEGSLSEEGILESQVKEFAHRLITKIQEQGK